MNKLSLIIAFIALLLGSCVKDQGDIFQSPGHGHNPPVEDSVNIEDSVNNIPPGNIPPANPSGDTAARDMKIKLRAIMTIGNVVYDSIPASLTIRSWDSVGQMTTIFYGMTAGTNQIDLQDGQARFQFLFKKWNSNVELNLESKDINVDSVYVLGVSKQAKNLRSQVVYRLNNGVYEPESKMDFMYVSHGKIDRITHSLKNEKGLPQVSMTSIFEYNGDRVAKINRIGSDNNLKGFTAFNYDASGRVISMSETENGEECQASVQYHSNIREEINIRYTYPARTYAVGYYMELEYGNLVKATKATTLDQFELVQYRYDMNINPYRHINWLDLNLSHRSKNNAVASVITSSNINPGAVPSSYSYTYDSDGYPKEVIISYKHGLYGNHLYTLKTVYTYH